MSEYYNDCQLEMLHKLHLKFFQEAPEDELAYRLKEVEEYNGNEGFSVGDYNESGLGGFHPSAIRMVERNDDCYLGCRANHFVLIFGQSEALWYKQTWADCVVSLANHKGGLIITVFEFLDEAERDNDYRVAFNGLKQ
jgi:hypothetical protein